MSGRSINQIVGGCHQIFIMNNPTSPVVTVCDNQMAAAERMMSSNSVKSLGEIIGGNHRIFIINNSSSPGVTVNENQVGATREMTSCNSENALLKITGGNHEICLINNPSSHQFVPGVKASENHQVATTRAMSSGGSVSSVRQISERGSTVDVSTRGSLTVNGKKVNISTARVKQRRQGYVDYSGFPDNPGLSVQLFDNGSCTINCYNDYKDNCINDEMTTDKKDVTPRRNEIAPYYEADRTSVKQLKVKELLQRCGEYEAWSVSEIMEELRNIMNE